MTITYPAQTFTSPNSCNHWRIQFQVTTAAGNTRTVTEHITRDDVTSPDPGEGAQDLLVFIAIIEARRMAKLAGAATRAQVNQALAGQSVVI